MSSDAGNFWNLSKNNVKESKDFFATRDVSNAPLSEISFANSAVKPLVVPSVVPSATIDNTESKDSVEKPNGEEGKDEVYCLELVTLNKSVLDWIKKHVEKNPCIDLTPVVRDYEKHLSSIGEKYTSRINVAQSKVFKTPEATHPSPVTSLCGKKESSVSFVASTPINDNIKPAVNKFPAGFFTPSCPTTISKSEPAKQNTIEENDPASDDAPPVVEKKTIVEEDAFYQTRSKLFFKKGNQWQELGVGMLYLKPSGEKIQLLIRMESVTGKVLLNISISKDLPINRSGKNNIMIVSLPNPHVYAKPADGDNNTPCTYLIRVKGTPEADQLYSKLRPDN